MSFTAQIKSKHTLQRTAGSNSLQEKQVLQTTPVPFIDVTAAVENRACGWKFFFFLCLQRCLYFHTA